MPQEPCVVEGAALESTTTGSGVSAGSGFHRWCWVRYTCLDEMPFAEAAVPAFGADRCMWGSAFPHVLAGFGYVRSTCCRARQRSSPESSST